MFFNIQRWSLHDGPGIRTTLFFRGCPLRCRWCCNPESWAVPQKPEDTGEAQALDTILRDAVFYRASGGGITFSGGEPFARPRVLARMAGAAGAAGIEVCAETCGFFEFESARPALDRISHLFIDLKHMDEDRHRELTGVSNRVILDNISRIDQTGTPFTIRIPLIAGLTDTLEDLENTCRFCRDLANLARVEFMPYHPLGEGKYAELGLDYDPSMAAPDSGRLDRIQALFKENKLSASCSDPSSLTNQGIPVD